jgi:hypothetical protein
MVDGKLGTGRFGIGRPVRLIALLAQDRGHELHERLLAVEAFASTRLHVLDASAVAPAAGIGVAGVLEQEGSSAR